MKRGQLQRLDLRSLQQLRATSIIIEIPHDRAVTIERLSYTEEQMPRSIGKVADEGEEQGDKEGKFSPSSSFVAYNHPPAQLLEHHEPQAAEAEQCSASSPRNLLRPLTSP